MIEEFTKKQYHKKYDHKLVIINNILDKNVNPTESVIRFLIKDKFPSASFKIMTTYITTEQRVWMKEQKIDKQFKAQSLILYFKDIEIYDYLKEKFNEKNFYLLEKPLNDSHKDILDDDTLIVTKNKLFFNKYRFAIRIDLHRYYRWNRSLYQSRKELVSEIDKWILSTFKFDDERVRKTQGVKANYFFANASDTVMFKMTFGSKVKFKIEKVLLADEVAC